MMKEIFEGWRSLARKCQRLVCGLVLNNGMVLLFRYVGKDDLHRDTV